MVQLASGHHHGAASRRASPRMKNTKRLPMRKKTPKKIVPTPLPESERQPEGGVGEAVNEVSIRKVPLRLYWLG